MARANTVRTLILVMAGLVAGVAAMVTWTLYDVAFNEQRGRLTEIALTNTAMIDAVAHFDAMHSGLSHPQGAGEATLSQIREAQAIYERLGGSTEIVVGRQTGTVIEFVVPPRHREALPDDPEALSRRFAAPMRQALAGQSGSTIALDYRGVTVLAAYRPIETLNLGLVAKVDLAEIRQPFLSAGLVVAVVVLVLMAMAALVTERLGTPLVRRATASEARYAQLVETMKDGLCVFDADGVVTYANDALCNMLATTRAQLVGNSVRRFVDEPVSRSIDWWRSNDVLELEFRRDDGSGLPVVVSPQDLPNGGAQPAERFMIVTDLTKRRELEEQLRQAHRMEAMGQLTGGVAHEFNNLLQVVTGNLELMQDAASGDDYLSRRLAGALGAVERGADLTSHLLSYSSKQILKPVVVSLPDQLNTMVRVIGPTLGETVDWHLDVAADLWDAKVDPGQLESAVLNLCLNARDAMSGGGTITISAENLPADRAGKDYVRISVADTGPGMPESVRDRAFEPFFTTKEVGEGTGLGLSMVYGFAQQSGGQAFIENAEGGGAKVSLLLPRAETSRVVRFAARAEEFEPPRGRARALVVDDTVDVLGVLGQLLESAGYQVETAETGDAALALLQSDGGFDLLVSDIAMPGELDGVDLVRRVSEILPGLGVVLTTGHSRHLVADQGRGLDGVPVLTKPFTRIALARALKQVEARGRRPA